MSYVWPVLLAFFASFGAYAASEVIREADKAKGGLLGGRWWVACFLFFATGAALSFLAILSFGLEEVLHDQEIPFGVKLLSLWGTIVGMFTPFGLAWLVVQGVASTSWFRTRLCPVLST